MYNVLGHQCEYMYRVIFNIMCRLSHAHLIMKWDVLYDRAFVNICENHVLY
jgi:hypothetical protein